MIYEEGAPYFIIFVDEFKRHQFRLGPGSNVEDISKALHGDGEGFPHLYINNKISQLQDDDPLVDVVEEGDILTGLTAGQDQPRSKDSPSAGDILVIVEKTHKMIYIPIDRPETFKFRESEFYPTIAVFK